MLLIINIVCVLRKSGAKDGGWRGVLVLFPVGNLIFERSFCFKRALDKK